MALNKALKKLSVLSLISGVTYATFKVGSIKTFDFIFKKNQKPDNISKKEQEWFEKSNVKELNINSFDGLKLYGYLVENNKTDNYIILVHGIWSSHTFMIPYAKKLSELGYNILLVDQRASGKSEGEYYSYGYFESFDIVAWSNYLIQENANVNIALMGVSMGAATCMMTTQIGMQENVKCIVEDCGFSCIKDEVKHVLKTKYNIAKSDLIMSIVEKKLYEKFKLHYCDISAKNCLNTNVLPIMFIHGDDDNFVPFKMAKELYDINPGEKIYYPVKGKAHARCCENKNYFKDVDQFIKKYF